MKEMTTPIKVDEPKKIEVKKERAYENEERKETVISSRDVEYFD